MDGKNGFDTLFHWLLVIIFWLHTLLMNVGTYLLYIYWLQCKCHLCNLRSLIDNVITYVCSCLSWYLKTKVHWIEYYFPTIQKVLNKLVYKKLQCNINIGSLIHAFTLPTILIGTTSTKSFWNSSIVTTINLEAIFK